MAMKIGSILGRSRVIREHARPSAEGEIGGDKDRGALIEATDEEEEKLSAGLCEGRITEFIEGDEVHASKMISNPALPPGAHLSLEPIDEVDGDEEAAARSGANAAPRDGDRQVGLAGPGAPDQHEVTLLADEGAAGEVPNDGLVDRRAL